MMIEKEAFDTSFKELWSSIVQRISQDSIQDLIIFNEEKKTFYNLLFQKDQEALDNFNEAYLSFKTWWRSFAGKFALQRSTDEKAGRIHEHLSEYLKQTKNQNHIELTIIVVYDEFPLELWHLAPFYVVVPIRHFYIKEKELILRLQQALDTSNNK
nr:hypothetical protein [Ectobacillus panaciterrae]